MKKIKRALGAAALVGMMTVAVTHAGTALMTTASSPTDGLSDLDFGPPPSLVESSVDLGDSYGAKAAAEVSGSSAARVRGMWYDGSSFHQLSASAKITQLAVNESGAPAEYQFHFSLTGPRLEVVDGAYVGTGPGCPTAIYAAQIVLNGVEIWSSTATLNGGRSGHTLSKSGLDLGGTYYEPDYGSFGYAFSGYSDTLTLGTFQNGDTVTVEAVLQVWCQTAGLELGCSAEIGDPNDLTGGSGLGGTLTVIPEPAVGQYAVLGCLILLASGYFGAKFPRNR